MIKYISYTAIALILATKVISAQDTLNYKQCVDYAIEHNIKFIKEGLNIDKQKLEYNNQYLNYLPQANIRGQYEMNKGRSIDPETNDITDKQYYSNSYALNTSLVLFNGFRKHNRVAYQKYILKSTTNNIDKAKNELTYNILELYGEALLNNGLAKIHNEQYSLSERELKKKEEMYKFGKAAKTDIYEAKARLAADKHKKILYSDMAKLSILKLKRMMHYPLDSSLNIKPLSKGIIQAVDTTGIFNNAKTNLPEIKSLNNQLMAAKKQVSIKSAELMPVLSAYYNMNSGYYETTVDGTGKTIPFNDQINNNRRSNFGLTLSIPIFSILSSRNSVKQAKIQYKQQSLDMQDRLKMLEYEIAEAHMTLMATNQEYISTIEYSETQQLAFIAAQKKKDKGIISLMDYYESKNTLAKAKSEVLRTRIQLFLKGVTIRYYVTGKMLQ